MRGIRWLRDCIATRRVVDLFSERGQRLPKQQQAPSGEEKGSELAKSLEPS